MRLGVHVVSRALNDACAWRVGALKVADLFNHQPEGPQTWAAMDDELDNPWQILRGDDGLLYVEISAHRLPFLRALIAPCSPATCPPLAHCEVLEQAGSERGREAKA